MTWSTYPRAVRQSDTRSVLERPSYDAIMNTPITPSRAIATGIDRMRRAPIRISLGIAGADRSAESVSTWLMSPMVVDDDRARIGGTPTRTPPRVMPERLSDLYAPLQSRDPYGLQALLLHRCTGESPCSPIAALCEPSPPP